MKRTKKEILDCIRNILIDFGFDEDITDDKLLDYTLGYDLNFTSYDVIDLSNDLEDFFKVYINIDLLPDTTIEEIVDCIYENQ